VKKLPILLLILSLLTLGATFFWHDVLHKKEDSAEQLIEFRNYLLKRESQLLEVAEAFSADSCLNFGDYRSYPEKWKKASEELQIALFRYDDENLLFWSDNTVPVGLDVLREYPDKQLWKLKNGWYRVRRIKAGKCGVTAMALIKREYSYQNDYLHDHFPGNETISGDAELYNDPVIGSQPVLDQRGKIAVWFKAIDDPLGENHRNSSLNWLIYLGLAMFLVSGHFTVFGFKKKHRRKLIFLWWFSLLLIRGISFYFKIPDILYASDLFNPSEYGASNWLPSLGDLFLNSIFLFYTVLLICQADFLIHVKRKVLFSISIVFVLLAFGWFCFDLLRGLIINSSISLDINDFLSLTLSSYISYLITGILFASFFLLADKGLSIVRHLEIRHKSFFTILGLLVFALTILDVFSGGLDFTLLPSVGILLCGIWLSAYGSKPYRYGSIIALIAPWPPP